jgi:Putative DnaT-like ssDNA binding protein
MAFLVEDGTGLVGANAGVSVAFADEYHSDRGNMLWVGADANKQSAIVRATGFTEQRFRHRYRGQRVHYSQTLSWPRLAAVDNAGYLIEGIPFQWQFAICEYALRALLYGELSPDAPPSVPRQNNAESTTSTTSQVITGEVKKQTNKVGSIEVTTEYVSPMATTLANIRSAASRESQTNLVNTQVIPQYPAADMWLEELLKSTSATVIPLEIG